MINGPVAGAGLGLALACDLRIAGKSARFGTAFARIGYSGDYGGSWSLTRLVGTAKARELYFTRRRHRRRQGGARSASSTGWSTTTSCATRRWRWRGASPTGRASRSAI